ncbi:MAG: hypothetical protein JWQ71_3766 [Pedosphaera sp.]|nr:hypothetical protein [Pedosphaera sp.]
MGMKQDEVENLILEIEHAFLRVERPEITLRVARGMDDHRYGELNQLSKADAHYLHWNEIPPADIERFSDVFPWLCPIGFRFYLPAFMIHSLKTSKSLRSESWPNFAFSETFLTKADVETLNVQQTRAVLHFLTAILATVPDDWNADWWNHPWDPEWSEDAEKKQIWSEIGYAYEQFKAHAEKEQ